MTVLRLAVLGALAACTAPVVDKATDETDDTDTAGTDSTPDSTDTGGTGLPDTDVVDTGLAYPWPSSPMNYTFERGTYLHEVVIPPAAGPQACCRDWGSASRAVGTDNALAAMNTFAKLASLDLNAELAVVIRSGSFVPVLDHRAMPQADGDYKLGFFLAEWAAGTTYTKASTGEGEFYVYPESFRPGTGKPQVVFRKATKTGNKIHAEGGDFEIALVIQNVNLQLPVRDVTIDANIVVDTLGLAVSDGELSGYVVVDELFEAYNGLVKSTCACASGLLDGKDLFTKVGDTWQRACQPHDSNPSATPPVVGVNEVCDEPAEAVCENLIGNQIALGGACALIGGAIGDVADLDLDGDGKNEALSVGLRAQGVPATLLGLVPTTP
ncbi:MAG: hypothetical protein H6732_13645 [Alphaproteobacteria bacterium]|nr:hypothetical protein [Alphaproteobacteria bacterium]